MRRALPEVSGGEWCGCRQEAVDVVALFERDEEDLAGAFAPFGEEVGVVRKRCGASGKVEPKSMEEERPSTRPTVSPR